MASLKDIRKASDTKSGLLTNDAQDLYGNKTVVGDIILGTNSGAIFTSTTSPYSDPKGINLTVRSGNSNSCSFNNVIFTALGSGSGSPWTDTGIFHYMPTGGITPVSVTFFINVRNSSQGSTSSQPSMPVGITFTNRSTAITGDTTTLGASVTASWQWVVYSGNTYKLQCSCTGAANAIVSGFAFARGGAN